MAHYMTDAVVLITADEIIEGILHYPAGIRFSDAFNASPLRDLPFVVLTHATVRGRPTGAELFKSEVLLTARNTIRMVIPAQEITALNLPGMPGADLDPPVGVRSSAP
jgi:hypothetical protein